ncbi:hypothetical protein ACXWTF_12810 [Thiomicrolovo sp. ZZH C-3]
MLINRLLTFPIALSLVASPFAALAETSPTEKCVLFSVQDQGLVGDLEGKRVFTTSEYAYQCTTTTVEEGDCIKYRESHTELNTSANPTGIPYISSDMGGSLGEMLGMISATEQINSIFSGWHGYCIDGLEVDFSGLTDPAFLAGIALSVAVATYGADYVQGAGQEAWSSGGAYAHAAKMAAEESAQLAVASLACAAQAGIDTYALLTRDDDIGCDPVDEFCGEEGGEGDSDQEFSLSVQDYNDIIAEDPDYADWIEIIRTEEDVLYVRIVMPPQETADSTKDAQEAAEKAREMARKIEAAVIVASMAACVGTAALTGSAATTATASDVSPTSTQAIGTKLASITATAICGPLCGAGVSVLAEFATSFKQVNSCGSHSDAEEQGPRHVSTYEHKRHDMCHKIVRKCIDESPWGDCVLNAEYHCCYDQLLTRVLMEQIKAQLGKNWAHCTDVNLNEFTHISFRRCTESDKAAGLDGTTLGYEAAFAERQQAYQYVSRCIDYDEYVAWLEEQTGSIIDLTELEDTLKGATENLK